MLYTHDNVEQMDSNGCYHGKWNDNLISNKSCEYVLKLEMY